MKPIVAIVGRPNVGKSTLFNRLIGFRKAITYNEAGVSRDRHYGHAFWDGREFVCVDTGGFPESSVGLKQKIRFQIELAIAESDLVLFVLDGQVGLLPQDRTLAAELRRSGKRVLMVVNKIDQESHEARLADFYALGATPFPVSAEHGYRIGDLLEEMVKGFPRLPEEKKSTNTRLAIIGRPNVGKSSLLNCLLGEERVVVDEAPGTTRDVIDTTLERNGKIYQILDTAGIRKKGKSDSRIERFSVLKTLQAVERAELCLLLLDATQEIHKQDAHVAGYADEAGKGIILVWNKWDRVSVKRGIEKIFRQKVHEGLKFLNYAPVLYVSATTGWGIESLWPAVEGLRAAYHRRVKTSELNETFQELLESHNRPVYKGAPVKFYYATQTSVAPPTFVVFVNEPQGVHFSYQRYLLNRFREEFHFGGSPLRIVFRKKN